MASFWKDVGRRARRRALRAQEVPPSPSCAAYPWVRGELPMADFCRRYELPEDIPSVLAQLRIKDAHALSRVYLRELRDKGMALRSVNMLQLAVIRFSSESTP